MIINVTIHQDQNIDVSGKGRFDIVVYRVSSHDRVVSENTLTFSMVQDLNDAVETQRFSFGSGSHAKILYHEFAAFVPKASSNVLKSLQLNVCHLWGQLLCEKGEYRKPGIPLSSALLQVHWHDDDQRG